MKLYYSPGACSLASHIILREAGLEFDLVKVDLRQKLTETGDNYLEINPRGAVPALGLAEGGTLTQGAAILQYIGRASNIAVFKPEGTLELARLQEMLGICGDLHSALGAFFGVGQVEAAREAVAAGAHRRLAQIEALLGENDYLLGEFTQADAYLFTVTSWGPMLKFDLSAYPKVLAHQARVAARPSVQAALKAEGLLG